MVVQAAPPHVATTAAVGTAAFNPVTTWRDQNLELTPDTLLAYCASQLGALDARINTLMGHQRLALAQKAAIEKAGSCLKHGRPTNADMVSSFKSEWEAAIESLPGGDPIRTQLEQIYTGLRQKTSDKSTSYNDTEWAGFTADVDELANNVGGGADLEMVELQSLVSKRQTAVQLTTALMQKIDSSSDGIVANIGR